jgi:glycosidase
MSLLSAKRWELVKNFPYPAHLTNFVDSHDQDRFASVVSDSTLYENALLIVLAYEGVPVVYYGAEQAANSSRCLLGS